MRRAAGRRTVVGRIVALVILIGLAAHLTSVGLDRADKLASSIGLLVAVAALVAPYLVPRSSGGNVMPNPYHGEHSGDARVPGGSHAGAGIEGPAGGSHHGHDQAPSRSLGGQNVQVGGRGNYQVSGSEPFPV